MKAGLILLILMLLVAVAGVAVQPAWSQVPFEPPAKDLVAKDTPDDAGRSIALRWQGSGEVSLRILRGDSPDGNFVDIGGAASGDQAFNDPGTTDGKSYYYRVAYRVGEETLYTSVVGPAVSRSNWLYKGRINALLLTVLMFSLVIAYISTARKGKTLYLRRIAGLAAIDEAIGRATEMGKKMLYVPGIMSIGDMQTIASLAILQHVAKQSAIYGTNLEVPNKDPLTFSAARETVRQAFLEAGKPDQFKEDMVTYLTYDQFAYAASVSGKMVRELPAANFLIGSFFAESLIFAETGQSIGAIQIAGTADVTQLPFFVTTCDYTLMGEELFAASAYLSREPVLLGSIKAQDITKAIIMMYVGAGIILLNIGLPILRNLLITR